MARRSKSKTIARRGLMLVLSSPSGAGKTTLSRMLLTTERNIELSISVTTRPKRKGEVNGRHYHFIDRRKFDLMVKNGDLLEYAEVFGNGYGTPRKPVEKALKAGRDVLFDIDWQGTQQVREAARDDTRVFVIFLDDYHTRLGSSLAVRQPLTQFIQTQIRPLDMVAIMYPLTPVQDIDFTRDHERILGAIQRFEGRKYRYQPRNLFEQQYERAPTEVVEQIRNQVVMTALRGLSVRLGSLREGRKTVIYVTHNVAEAVYLADRIVVLTPHPGTVKADIRVGLGRPRDTLSVEFLECQREVVAHLR